MSQKNTVDRKPDEDLVRDKIAQLPAFQDVAWRLNEIITKAAPELKPRLWYGMPGYAKKQEQPGDLLLPRRCRRLGVVRPDREGHARAR